MPMTRAPDTKFITVKLRSRNTENGTSGSRSCCSHWNDEEGGQQHDADTRARAGY